MKNTIKLAIMLLAVSAVMSTSCKKDPQAPNNGKENGHEWVDLGLPSGLKWATCNIGADKPEAYGNYFAWGETEPKTTYDWNSYKYGNGTYDITKYCSQTGYGNEGFTDTLTILQSIDDAASVNWGGTWRLPTVGNMRELRDNCTYEWTTQNDVNGYLFTAQNGNSIFLPAAGYYHEGELCNAGEKGYYWSSSLYTDCPDGAYYSYFDLYYYYLNDYGRYNGMVLRPVCPAKK